MAIPCDVRNRNEVSQMVTTVAKHFGQLDVLINNAGVIQVGPMEEMRLADFEEAMQVHFWGPLHTITAALPYLRQSPHARITNIVSIGGKIAVPHLLPYSASKFALAGLSEGLRSEMAKDGIKVTTVFPGLMRTGSAGNAFFKGRHREEYAWFSVGASSPGLSISAESAARKILRATRKGQAEIVLGLPAKLAIGAHTLFPELSARVFQAVNRFLPGPGGIGSERARGRHSGSAVSPSVLTILNDRAAERNNETGASAPEEASAA
jgi:short-subunit dehydrogenase